MGTAPSMASMSPDGPPARPALLARRRGTPRNDRRRGAGPAGTRSTAARSVRIDNGNRLKAHRRIISAATVPRSPIEEDLAIQAGIEAPERSVNDTAHATREREGAEADRGRAEVAAATAGIRSAQAETRLTLAPPAAAVRRVGGFGEIEKRTQQRSASSGSGPLSWAQDLAPLAPEKTYEHTGRGGRCSAMGTPTRSSGRSS